MLKNGKIPKKKSTCLRLDLVNRKKFRAGETYAIEKVVGVDPPGGHPQDWRTPPLPGHTQCVAQWGSKN